MSRSHRLVVFMLLIMALMVSVSLVPAVQVRSSPVAAPENSAFGTNTHIGTRIGGKPEVLAEAASKLADLGVGWAREDFQFWWIADHNGNNAANDPANYYWDTNDVAVEQLRSRSINIIGILTGPSPTWATQATSLPRQQNFYHPDPQLYAAFVRAVVSRYKDRVHYWEIWNEPDNELYWRPEPNISQYTDLLKVGYQAVKETDPNAKVLVAGMVSPEPAAEWLEAIANQGGWNSFDIISLHPYTDPWGPEEGNIVTGGLEKVQTLAEKLGPKPIWVTEFGWSTGPGGRGYPDTRERQFTEAEQANFLVRGAAMLYASGAERVLTYKLKDETTSELYGMFRYNGSNEDLRAPKESFTYYRTLNEQLAGTSPGGLLDLVQPETKHTFETFGTWISYPPGNGAFNQTSAQRHSGNSAGEIQYHFTATDNNYISFEDQAKLDLGSPNRVGIWVKGDGSKNTLKVQILDAESEKFQFRLGFIPSGEWTRIEAPVKPDNPEEDMDKGSGNGRIDYPIRLYALVLDDDPDGTPGQGVVYVDDLYTVSGADAYGARFRKGGSEVVDVLWSPGGPASISVNTGSSRATVVESWGAEREVQASGGKLTLAIGPNPIYLIHTPGSAPPPPDPTPAPTSTTEPPASCTPIDPPAGRRIVSRRPAIVLPGPSAPTGATTGGWRCSATRLLICASRRLKAGPGRCSGSSATAWKTMGARG
ncbi:MAG: hypothetical protein HC884_01850 [Chloroflexaceae bacterium]|nr:hypothetical protein [Chloroflexaceae bacterium]